MSNHKEFHRGLIVGKFCPLHRGHEFLIKSALEMCDEVLIISYTKPEFENCEPAKREKWITALFPEVKKLVINDSILLKHCQKRNIAVRNIPHNNVSDNEHREFCAWLCYDLLQLTIDVVFTSENYGEGFAELLTAYFNERNKINLQVKHVSVDRARTMVPISGTEVRASPYENRKFLSSIVYKDFVQRVCFLGGESTGKTTSSQLLAKHYLTICAPEYGRELWEEKQGILQFEDMLNIAQTQIAREEELIQEANVWLFCDTSPLTTLFYSLSMFEKADVELINLVSRRYDFVFLCAPDFPFVQDGTRRNTNFSHQQHEWYCNQLSKRQIEFTLLKGSIEQRIQTVILKLNANLASKINYGPHKNT